MKQTLNKKEAEAIVWVLSEIIDLADQPPGHPLEPRAVIISAGYLPRPTLVAAQRLEQMAFDGEIGEPLSPLERLILQTCVENSTWINIYRTSAHTADSPAHIKEALATLRSLSGKLEAFGIEISHIPFT